MSLRFEHGFPNDVFISIAANDDADGLTAHEWASLLADALKRRGDYLRKTLRIRHNSHLFEGNAEQEQLEASALLLVVVSPAYLTSTDCARHRAIFLSANTAVMNPRAYSRMLRVDKAPVPEGDALPPEVADLTRHQFYRHDPDAYREFDLDPARISADAGQAVNDVARAVLDGLAAVEAAVAARVPLGQGSSVVTVGAAGGAAEPRERTAVHLALATGDIDTNCGELRRWFEDSGYDIVGHRRGRDAASFRAEVSKALAGVRLAVFPVGREYGWQPDGGDGRSFVALQLEAALNFPAVHRIVWIPKGLDGFEEEQRGLVEDIRKIYPDHGFEVLEVTFQQLVDHLKSRGRKSVAPVVTSDEAIDDLRVYLMYDLCDHEAAAPYRQFLIKKGVEVDCLSEEGAKSGRLHRYWLAEDHGVVIYYANSGEVWYRHQEVELRKAKGYRRKPGGHLKSLTLLDPPVSNHKEDLRLKPSRVLDGLPPKELEEKLRELDAFVDALKRNGGGSPPA